MKRILIAFLLVLISALALFGLAKVRMTPEQSESWEACLRQFDKSEGTSGFIFDIRPISEDRRDRFLGKPSSKDGLLCRGGQKALTYRDAPWVDWSNYWGAGDASSLPKERFPWSLLPNRITGAKSRGVNFALVDLEYQRMELIKFNLFDNNTFEDYLGKNGSTLKEWPELRLPVSDAHYGNVAVGKDGSQKCQGELIRHRNLTGICNDIHNPRMGSTNMVFARNVQFETTFPDLPVYGNEEDKELLENRHGNRISLLQPDPQLISRKLFTRSPEGESQCNGGLGVRASGFAGLRDDSLSSDSLTTATLEQYLPTADCDYQKAAWMNVMAAYWIQFMTHDWFSHLEEGHNAPEMMAAGCSSDEAAASGCQPGIQVDRALVENEDPPGTFTADGQGHLKRAPKTFRNTVTGWWDASQIYGYDEASRRRVKRDPRDPAKLLMVRRGNHPGVGEEQGYLPLLDACESGDTKDDCYSNLNPAWVGQEATAFPSNFTIGLSFYHNVFAREHNLFVDHFRAQDPKADSGLRDPAKPNEVILNGEVTDDQLFEIARIVIAAEIAKIHTIEWTTQLLYDEPLYKAMNANWNGLLDPSKHEFITKLLEKMTQKLNGQDNQFYSVMASGPGIFGLGSRQDDWKMTDDDINGGVNHFGSPFNFPEEFVTVYRLHPLVPDLAEFRELDEPEKVRAKVPIVDTFEKGSARAMTAGGLANWAISLGRQRLGALGLNNHPRFLQHLKVEHLPQELDVAALDIIRDRERGVPRYNEFRRQYGLRQLTSFDDFADDRLKGTEAYNRQLEAASALREIYGQHRCDASKRITSAQKGANDLPINDCLGHEDGSLVDNIEDVDAVVGWLSEFRRPHGFAISETQFAVFILNASRRLFSDRFFTSSFRPEFYSGLGHDWVNFNGPCDPAEMVNGRCKKQRMAESNGHAEPVSPLKRILLRTIPELEEQLQGVVNVFDPWTRDRGEYYSLAW